MEELVLSSKLPNDHRHRFTLITESAIVRVLVVFTSLFLTMSCSVPSSGKIQTVDPAQIPYELNATTTSTIGPSSLSSWSPGDNVDGTPSVEAVSLFFIAGSQVVPITRMLLSPASASQVYAALAEGVPPGDTAAGLRTAIPESTAVSVVVERGIARVELPGEFTSAIPGAEQRMAIAQIVLTLTRRSGIGQVVFSSAGQPQSVPRGRGDLTQPGGSVACEDYSNLLPAGFAC